jgi:hypothetical protein
VPAYRPARGDAGAVHLAEQPEQQVVGAGALDGVGDGVAEQVAGQQADVLGEHRHHRLQHEALGGLPIDSPADQVVEHS